MSLGRRVAELAASPRRWLVLAIVTVAATTAGIAGSVGGGATGNSTGALPTSVGRGPATAAPASGTGTDPNTTLDVPATTGGPTTTMPPRAAPVRLAPTGPGQLLGTVIVVDPGHNGLNAKYSDVRRAGSLAGDGPICNTAGAATNAGLDEMVINWEIGTRLATILRANGAEVILTHTDLKGFGPCADERGIIARDANATALVSIHADGSESGSGFHIIFPAAKPTLDPAQVAASGRLARLVRDELRFIGGRPANYVGTDGVQERDDLANLNQANRPSILAELGNLRNATDAAMLSNPVSYMAIARALARALFRFLGRTPDHADLSADIGGDGLVDYLLGAPQLATTTTIAAPVVPETAPQDTGAPATVPPESAPPTGG
ncbi:MAG: N-acetylmuramoyl-L-alanine amidase [Acidimicrobiales bacterium]